MQQNVAAALSSRWSNSGRSAVDIAREAINSKTLTLEAISAIGRLDELATQVALHVLTLEPDDEQNQKADQRQRFDRAIASALHGHDTTLQRYWHAHYLEHNIRNWSTDRAAVEYALAHFCARVWWGEIPPPAGFTRDFFSTMVVLENQKPVPKTRSGTPVDLKTQYKRVTKKTILATVANQLVPAGWLPPLSDARP
jgi:hypothetical protein